MTFGLVASPPGPDSPTGATVSFGAFWPAILLTDAREVVRIGGNTIPDPRLIEALKAALVSVDNELADWKATQIETGYTTLLDVPAPVMSRGHDQEVTETRLSWIWRRAVLANAAADLLETHRDVTSTKEATDRADEMVPTAADHRRNAIHAVRDILGQPRTTVELI